MVRVRSREHFQKGAVSSAVERLVYTERVGGSNPSPPTNFMIARPGPLALFYSSLIPAPRLEKLDAVSKGAFQARFQGLIAFEIDLFSPLGLPSNCCRGGRAGGRAEVGRAL